MRHLGMIGALMLVVILMLAGVGEVYAQKSAIKVEAMSIDRLTKMSLPNPNGWDNVSSGLTTVGVGTRAWLSAWDITGDSTYKAGASYTWLLTKPAGSTAALDSTTTQWTSFKPDVVGDYVIRVTVGSKDTSVTITAAKYIGANRSNIETNRTNCGTCHSSFVQFTGWKDSKHGAKFQTRMNTGPAYWGESCFKCHTVGYNKGAANDGFDDIAASVGFVDTLWKPWRAGLYDSLLTTTKKEVSMFAGIGCENCHGPFKSHFTTGVQPKSMSAGVCAQCHDEPWRHNRVAQWENTPHSGKVATPANQRGFTGTTVVTTYTLDQCVRCHDGQAFVNFTQGRSFDRRTASGYSRLARTPINCQTCHDPHTAGLRTVPASSDTLANGYNYTGVNFGTGKTCVNCHKYRRYGDREVLSNMSTHWGPHYLGITDVFLGHGAAGVQGLVSGHKLVNNTCVGCHMQATPDTGSVARDQIGMHTWKMSYTAPNNTKYDNVTVCKSCHGNITKFDDIIAFMDYDGNGTKEAFVTEVENIKNRLARALPPYGTETIDRTAIAASPDSLKLKKAFWNYLYVKYEGSHGIHNPSHVVNVLQQSLILLGYSPTGMELAESRVPGTFELSQNYPNPFNPSTEIRFSLARASDVRLDIYDIMGRVVATLIQEPMTAGYHKVTWEGKDNVGQRVTSGVYFYRITAGEFVATKKMVVIK